MPKIRKKLKEEGRRFHEKWENMYFCVERRKIVRLICDKEC
jgi:hypothetical protein